MKEGFTPTFYDRQSGTRKREIVYGEAFLHWLYNTWSGDIANHLLFKHRLFSVLYGCFSRSSLSKGKIEPFVEKLCVDRNVLTQPLDRYTTFRDFFVREIDPAKRPICQDPSVCISPVDGKVLVYEDFPPDRTFRIKRTSFDLGSFLRDETLVKLFSRGTMFVCRLGLADYHHFHFPDSGIPGRATPIAGKYFAGGPYALNSLTPFFKENHRMIALIDSDNFSLMAMVEIGALTVGSIRQDYVESRRVDKGEKKGYFEPGGSTVVLLFQQGIMEPDEDIRIRSAQDQETYLVFGDSIGRKR